MGAKVPEPAPALVRVLEVRVRVLEAQVQQTPKTSEHMAMR
jgi:hypothetical protein